MPPSEIRMALNNFEFQEVRVESEDYFEAVVNKSELDKMTPTLERFFGKAVPSMDILSPQAKAKVKELGGVMPGQSLYLKCEGEAIIFAMVWPWGSGTLITIKIKLR